MPDLSLDPALFETGEQQEGPQIAVVVSLTFPGMNQDAYDLAYSLTKCAFDQLRDLNANPVLIDSARPGVYEVERVCAEAHGILFLGGGDVDTRCYGYTGPEPRGYYGVDRKADEFCIALFHEAKRQDLPTLSFCRGSQLQNVAFGGTLIGDIENWQTHRGPGGQELMIDEPVEIVEGSLLADIYPQRTLTVRNGHHQAVDRVGDELRVAARAADGIVEATEHRTASWMLGMQWHPEEVRANLEDRRRIFEALTVRARARQLES